jgi:hypothetical protein
MTGHDDFAFEPIPGLPAEPPKGEVILWQGSPDTLALARQAYGLGWVAAYFAALILWRGFVGFGLAGFEGALAYGLPYVGLAILGCGLVWLLAFLQARAAVYTITSSRVAMRIGAALTVTLNLPFTQIGAAGLSLGRKGTGTIVMETLGDTHLSYLILWPHLRPWAMAPTKPALRCIPDAAEVAKILADAAETRVSQPQISRAGAAAPQANMILAE